MKKNPQPNKLKGLRFLALIFLAYGILFMTNNQQAQQSLNKAIAIMTQILPIIGVVVVINGLINWWLPAKRMAQLFKDQGAKKSWGIAIIAGILSHGPMYLWYPMIADLRKSGVPDGIVVSYFYARAVKIPLLPLMVDYFGTLFSTVLVSYILIAALLQGLLMQWWNQRARYAASASR